MLLTVLHTCKNLHSFRFFLLKHLCIAVDIAALDLLLLVVKFKDIVRIDPVCESINELSEINSAVFVPV